MLLSKNNKDLDFSADQSRDFGHSNPLKHIYAQRYQRNSKEQLILENQGFTDKESRSSIGGDTLEHESLDAKYL